MTRYQTDQGFNVPDDVHLPYSTAAPWVAQPVTTNNQLGSQHALAWSQDASSLQYLAAPDANSNRWTDANMSATSQITNGYGRHDQAQWSALDNDTNVPLRDDTWTPWVMPVHDEDLEEEHDEVGYNHARDDGEQVVELRRNSA
ncbi:hypothetical protein PG994_000939 [Apiospora phragmitis]|uniref:Uncharacterized protein n=1 Tax=Apiospora phragmitis TaxID=2905665 RepID=A0ABR1WR12_9PEZI